MCLGLSSYDLTCSAICFSLVWMSCCVGVDVNTGPQSTPTSICCDCNGDMTLSGAALVLTLPRWGLVDGEMLPLGVGVFLLLLLLWLLLLVLLLLLLLLFLLLLLLLLFLLLLLRLFMIFYSDGEAIPSVAGELWPDEGFCGGALRFPSCCWCCCESDVFVTCLPFTNSKSFSERMSSGRISFTSSDWLLAKILPSFDQAWVTQSSPLICCRRLRFLIVRSSWILIGHPASFLLFSRVSIFAFLLINFTMMGLFAACENLPTRWQISNSHGAKFSPSLFFRMSLTSCSVCWAVSFLSVSRTPKIRTLFLREYCSRL